MKIYTKGSTPVKSMLFPLGHFKDALSIIKMSYRKSDPERNAAPQAQPSIPETLKFLIYIFLAVVIIAIGVITTKETRPPQPWYFCLTTWLWPMTACYFLNQVHVPYMTFHNYHQKNNSTVLSSIILNINISALVYFWFFQCPVPRSEIPVVPNLMYCIPPTLVWIETLVVNRRIRLRDICYSLSFASVYLIFCAGLKDILSHGQDLHNIETSFWIDGSKIGTSFHILLTIILMVHFYVWLVHKVSTQIHSLFLKNDEHVPKICTIVNKNYAFCYVTCQRKGKQRVYVLSNVHKQKNKDNFNHTTVVKINEKVVSLTYSSV